MALTAGYVGKLGISASNPVDQQFDFISESVMKRGTNIDHLGLRGTRSHSSERVRSSNFSVGGTISMQPCPEELALLLPWILGANASGTTFALAETLPSRYVTIDRGAKVFTYAGCKVARATFTASEGSPLSLDLEIVGTTETVGNSGTFPSLTPNDTPPFMFHDAVASLVSSSRSFKSFRCVVDNGLLVAYNNSQSASFIEAGDRVVSVDMTTPYSSSETDLYGQAVAGAAATVTFTNGNYSCAFAFAALQVPDNSPTITTKNGEVVLSLSGIARRTTATRELIVTLDSTP